MERRPGKLAQPSASTIHRRHPALALTKARPHEPVGLLALLLFEASGVLNMRRPSSGGLVYSTDGGRMCASCRKPVAKCACAPMAPQAPRGDGVVRVGRETKGRGGKVVTVIRGLELDAAALAALGKRLRTACGAGGTVKDGVLEIQGDHHARLIDYLTAEGWKVKRVGG